MSGPLVLGQVVGRLVGANVDAALVASLGEAVLVGRVPAEDDGGWQFRTSAGKAVALPPMLDGSGFSRESMLWPLRKMPGSPPPKDWIIVGRASSNDVVVVHSTVSKVHGRVQLQSPGKAIYVDAGSSNGSSVGLSKLPAESPHPIHDGEILSLGNVALTFMWKSSLLRVLTRQGGKLG
jgi:hypothetical protein